MNSLTILTILSSFFEPTQRYDDNNDSKNQSNSWIAYAIFCNVAKIRYLVCSTRCSLGWVGCCLFLDSNLFYSGGILMNRSVHCFILVFVVFTFRFRSINRSSSYTFWLIGYLWWFLVCFSNHFIWGGFSCIFWLFFWTYGSNHCVTVAYYIFFEISVYEAQDMPWIGRFLQISLRWSYVEFRSPSSTLL